MAACHAGFRLFIKVGRRRRLVISAFRVISVLLLTSCTTLVTSEGTRTNETVGATGIAYALPKGQILVVATRAPVDVAALQTALANAQTALAAAKKPPSNGAPAPPDTDPAVMAAKTAVDAATTKLDLLAPMGPNGRVPTLQETVTLTALPFVPDPAARYVATFNHRPWRDDNFQLTVSNGLLSSGSLVSVDQMPAILATLAGTVISASLGVPRPAPGAVHGAAGVLPGTCQYAFAGVFDPLNGEELANLNAHLASARGDSYLEIGVMVPGTQRMTAPSVQEPPFAGSPASPGNVPIPSGGLFYRVATPVVITAEYTSGATSPAAQCRLTGFPAIAPVTTIVPDSRQGEEVRVDADAGWLTATTLGLTFSNGMLTSDSVQRPSELMSLFGIPAAIINQYVSIVTNFIQLKVNYATAEATIAAQRQSELAAQVAQLQSLAQMALAGPTASAQSQLALLQLQQQLQTIKQQLASPTTAAQ